MPDNQQMWKTSALEPDALDMSYRPPRGRNAMIACVIGSILIICALAAYRPSINYKNADASNDAMRAFAHGDTRYVAVQGDQPSVTLSAGQTLSAGEPLEINRDIRLVPPVSPGSAKAAQDDYLAKYNDTMKVLVHQPGHGQVQRPTPMSRPMFAIETTLAVLPIILTFYLRYRLGPYRRDGSSWTADFLRVLPVYLLPKRYTEAARPLLLVLWIDVALIIPWLLLVIFSFGDRPLR